MVYDIAVIGTGPAGLSAALNACRHNKSVILIGKEQISSKMVHAKLIENYPGLPHISGRELNERLYNQAIDNGAEFRQTEISDIYFDDGKFLLLGRSEKFVARKVILAIGLQNSVSLPGEEEFIGRGVSCCATCDGMFFRDKDVAIIGYIKNAEVEAEFLSEICNKVYYLPLYPEVGELNSKIEVISGNPLAIEGTEAVENLVTSIDKIPVSGVFIERSGKAPENLFEGLAIHDGYITVDEQQRTNISGIYAAGDCTGKPAQIARAVGQGQVAALAAVVALYE